MGLTFLKCISDKHSDQSRHGDSQICRHNSALIAALVVQINRISFVPSNLHIPLSPFRSKCIPDLFIYLCSLSAEPALPAKNIFGASPTCGWCGGRNINFYKHKCIGKSIWTPSTPSTHTHLLSGGRGGRGQLLKNHWRDARLWMTIRPRCGRENKQ